MTRKERETLKEAARLIERELSQTRRIITYGQTHKLKRESLLD